MTGGRAKAWCLRMHGGVSLSHGGQGESLVPPYTRGSVSLSRGAGRRHASVYTRKRLSHSDSLTASSPFISPCLYTHTCFRIASMLTIKSSPSFQDAANTTSRPVSWRTRRRLPSFGVRSFPLRHPSSSQLPYDGGRSDRCGASRGVVRRAPGRAWRTCSPRHPTHIEPSSLELSRYL